MKLTLKSKHTVLLGLKGTGKSNALQALLTRPEYRHHLVYDFCREHDALNRYRVTHRRGDKAAAEFQQVVDRMVLSVPSDRRPEVFAVEEMSRLCGPRSPPPEAMYELVDMNRHYGVGIMAVARRPAQLHADVVELADNMLIFRLTGSNDHRRLEDINPGLGDAVRELDDYHYVHVGPDREYRVRSPFPEQDTTGDL